MNALKLAATDAVPQDRVFWQWMRMPGEIVFAAGALLMAWYFVAQLRVQRGTSEPAPRPGGPALLDRPISD